MLISDEGIMGWLISEFIEIRSAPNDMPAIGSRKEPKNIVIKVVMIIAIIVVCTGRKTGWISSIGSI